MDTLLSFLRRSPNTDHPEDQSLSTTQMHATTDEALPSEFLDSEPINEDHTSGEILTPSLCSSITVDVDFGNRESIGQLVRPGVSLLRNENSLNDWRTTREMPTSSLLSLQDLSFSSDDLSSGSYDDSVEMDALCQAFRRLSIVHIQNACNERIIERESTIDIREESSKSSTSCSDSLSQQIQQKEKLLHLINPVVEVKFHSRGHLFSRLPMKNSTDAFCQVFRNLKLFSQKPYDENSFMISHPADHSDMSSLLMIESLPWPALKRLFYSLYPNDGDYSHLCNLSQASTHFHHAVHEFMKRDGTRPGINEVLFTGYEHSLEVEILLFPSNIPFHDMTNLDWGRFDRSLKDGCPALRVTVIGPEDPIIEQLADFLGSSIKEVSLGGDDNMLSSSDLSLCAKLLHSAIIKHLHYYVMFYDAASVPFINSIISRAKNYLYIWSDP